MFLTAKELWDIVSGTEEAPAGEEQAAELAKFKKRDNNWAISVHEPSNLRKKCENWKSGMGLSCVAFRREDVIEENTISTKIV